MSKIFRDDRRQVLEESHFVKHNREIFELMRAADEAGTRPLPVSDVAAGADAEPSLPFGTDPRSLAVLSLAPLFAMAWAGGGIADRDRNMVRAMTASLGLTQSSSARPANVKEIEDAFP